MAAEIRWLEEKKGFDISPLKGAGSASREASETRVAGLMAPFLSGEQIIA